MFANAMLRLRMLVVSGSAALGVGVYHDLLASGALHRDDACS